MQEYPGYHLAGVAVEARDREHLGLLRIFHLVYAGVTVLLSLLALVYMGVAAATLTDALPPPLGSARSSSLGWLFLGMGALTLAFGLAIAALNLFAARSLERRTRHTFCLVVAAINCLNMPLGTALGVFTILVLIRPTVRSWFGSPAG